MTDYPPPYNADIERKLLGGLIHSPETFPVVEAILSMGEEAFYNTKHKAIYKTISKLHKESKPFDIVLLKEELANANKSVTISELYDIQSCQFTGELNERYSTELLEIYKRRVISDTCKIALDNITRNIENDTIIGDIENTLQAINSTGRHTDAEDISIIANNWWEAQQNRENPIDDRIYTGWEVLDKYVAIYPGNHIVIGARTSMGKTSFAINLATNIALSGKRPLLFTMEQSKKSIAPCYIAQIADVSRHALLTNTLSNQQKEKVTNTKPVWGSNGITNMGVIDKSWSAQQIRNKIIMERLKRPVDAVIIDFLHNMKAPRGMGRQGHEWLRETVTQLEEIAIDLNVTIFTLAQVSRGVESREDKRPISSDLREAGEDNADIVMFIYRDEYYNPETTQEPGVAEIIIAKNRNGKTGIVKLAFMNYSTAFKDLERREPLPASWTNRYD